MKVGMLGNKEVLISEKALNKHILVTGLSGSGKSVRIREMISDAVDRGETVLVFDINGTDYKECSEKTKYTSAITDGITLNFLNPGDQEGEEYIQIHAMHIVGMFANAYRLGDMQCAALREIIIKAIKDRDIYDSETKALCEFFENESVKNKNLYEKMWRFLNTSILKKGSFLITEEYLNVLSFECIEPTLQKIVIELILAVMWRQVQIEGKREKALTIVIDEFQNLSLHNNSVLLQMLREGRKYGINLILSTQSIADCSKEMTIAVGQAATQLYFRQEPTAISATLKKIDAKMSRYWREALMKMKVGESIAYGEFCINGKKIDGPIIVKSDYKEQEKFYI